MVLTVAAAIIAPPLICAVPWLFPPLTLLKASLFPDAVGVGLGSASLGRLADADAAVVVALEVALAVDGSSEEDDSLGRGAALLGGVGESPRLTVTEMVCAPDCASNAARGLLSPATLEAVEVLRAGAVSTLPDPLSVAEAADRVVIGTVAADTAVGPAFGNAGSTGADLTADALVTEAALSASLAPFVSPPLPLPLPLDSEVGSKPDGTSLLLDTDWLFGGLLAVWSALPLVAATAGPTAVDADARWDWSSTPDDLTPAAPSATVLVRLRPAD